MTCPILDFADTLVPALGAHGVDPDRLDGDLATRFAQAHEQVQARRDAGEMGFFQLPLDHATADTVQSLADGFGQWFENLVVLGIGGSGLGAITLREGLLGQSWNERSDEDRSYFPRLYVLDNPDPETARGLLSRLDLRRTLVNVVSKSGTTAETMALYLVIRGMLAEVIDTDNLHGHFIFTTDPERGVLRALAEEEGVPTLAIPPNVGGRFSVLTPVGLFPAAITGVPVRELLDGAAHALRRCESPRLRENPAGMLATLLHLFDTEMGRPIHVLMPYADRLRALTLWFQQLWAESLGKIRGEGHVGPTPLPAVGATDQHAQVQLFMEGPHDKVVVFVASEASDDLPIPSVHPRIPELSYLSGASLGRLLEAERRATREALRRRGRPSLTLEVGPVTPASLGGILMLLEIATVYAGALYGVDPLDQPGVELGKVLTYGLMGREGFEVPQLPDPDPRWRV
ncbi:MAG: glucose-6-phosphate isomerase [Gemmatimonadales bacterium]|nr:MAG: glucose-6-phosphate isomerase [Gemmatimonadales bacterium]